MSTTKPRIMNVDTSEQDMARPKHFGGKAYSGTQLASLVERMVEALNSQEIPNVAQLIEVFNHDLVRVGAQGQVGE